MEDNTQKTENVTAAKTESALTRHRLYIEPLLLIFFTMLMLCVSIYLIENLTGLLIFHHSGDSRILEESPIVGIPLSTFIALFIVLFLRYAAGPIEIEGFGVKFRGASGPIILWIICFLAVTYGFHLLAPKHG